MHKKIHLVSHTTLTSGWILIKFIRIVSYYHCFDLTRLLLILSGEKYTVSDVDNLLGNMEIYIVLEISKTVS